MNCAKKKLDASYKNFLHPHDCITPGSLRQSSGASGNLQNLTESLDGRKKHSRSLSFPFKSSLFLVPLFRYHFVFLFQEQAKTALKKFAGNEKAIQGSQRNLQSYNLLQARVVFRGLIQCEEQTCSRCL